jgi:antitoxin (DNA-binding transcriptional repressor) of toxin-antitoxin stability system
VQSGERLVVTDRKRPIAELGPVARRRMSQEQWFQFLEETGELTRATRPRRFKDVTPTKIRGGSLSATILQGRR